MANARSIDGCRRGVRRRAVLLGPSVLLDAQGATNRAPAAQAQRPPALLQDYVSFSVTVPPPALALDPFYEKYADAHGIPVVSSQKVPDAALLLARDIVQFMLANRPEWRRGFIRKKLSGADAPSGRSRTARFFDDWSRVPRDRRTRAADRRHLLGNISAV